MYYVGIVYAVTIAEYFILRNRSLYACESFDEFVNCTVLKIEKLSWHAVAATVKAFVARYVDRFCEEKLITLI